MLRYSCEATSQVDVPACPFGDCRKGQISVFYYLIIIVWLLFFVYCLVYNKTVNKVKQKIDWRKGNA